MRRPEGQGKFVRVVVVNPTTVCEPEALLVGALVSLGVRQHPLIPFEILEQEIDGVVVTAWQWVFKGASEDGRYNTGDLVKWWHDEGWFAANPTHELTTVRAVLLNMAAVAKGIRDSFPRLVLESGDVGVRIPANATPARRQYLLDIFEGRIPFNAPFVEPGPAEAAA